MKCLSYYYLLFNLGFDVELSNIWAYDYRQERSYNMNLSSLDNHPEKVKILRPNPQQFYGGSMFMMEGSFIDMHNQQEEEGDDFDIQRFMQMQMIKSDPVYRKMNRKK